MELSERDRDLLAAVAAGETISGYAARNRYSVSWGEWRSKEIRRRLGVKTMREAVELYVSGQESEQGVSRADFDKLSGMVARLGEALEDLADAKPADQPDAREVVRERELSLKDHAQALGLSLKDVELLKEERDFEKFRAFQERLEAEREEEAAAAAANGGEERPGALQQIRDGLGGIRNVKP